MGKLVAYSGFSSSNYLEQPYNSDLDFGTGDFCVMGWAYKSSDSPENSIISRGQVGTTNGFTFLGTNINGYLYYYIGNYSAASALKAPNGAWFHAALVRRSGQIFLYLNGVEQPVGASSNSVSNTSAKTIVGHSAYSLSVPFNGSLALLRISATAPSASQIAKIYEDEKVLFQENAKATLYGTSDSVTALAHDSDTNLLHVGTSSGRSVFQGLRRVDNTTDAVGSAISASNGLVVED